MIYPLIALLVLCQSALANEPRLQEENLVPQEEAVMLDCDDLTGVVNQDFSHNPDIPKLISGCLGPVQEEEAKSVAMQE